MALAGLRSLGAPLFVDGTMTLGEAITRELSDWAHPGAPDLTFRSLGLLGSYAFRHRRQGKTSSSKVRLSGVQNQRLKRFDRLDRLLGKAVRLFRRWWGLILKEGPLLDWAKPANSDRDQQSDNSNYDENDDGRDVRTTRPQEPARCWRQTIFIRRVFIILRRRPLSAITGAAHLFAVSPSSSCGWPGPVVLVVIDWLITGRLPVRAAPAGGSV
jgi:hypothetical protein